MERGHASEQGEGGRMISNYLSILQDSLVKKLDVLKRIAEVNEAQTQLLKQQPVDMETFDQCVDEKDLYIKELLELDEGFENLYDKIKQELVGNRNAYATQIQTMQGLITDITALSASIQAQEERNKSLVEAYFKSERMNLGQVRKNSRAAYGYYQNMNTSHTIGSRFLDKKQ